MVNLNYFRAHLLRTWIATGVILILLVVGAALAFAPPFGKWTRLVSQPILSPQGNGFE